MRVALIVLALALPLAPGSALAQAHSDTGEEVATTGTDAVMNHAVETPTAVEAAGLIFTQHLACTEGDCAAAVDSPITEGGESTGVTLQVWGLDGTGVGGIPVFDHVVENAPDVYHYQPHLNYFDGHLYAFAVGADDYISGGAFVTGEAAKPSSFGACYDTAGTAAPWYRRIPLATMTDLSTWSPTYAASPQGACLPAKTAAGADQDLTALRSSGIGPAFQDLHSTVHPSPSTLLLFGEVGPWGAGSTGIGRAVYRITPGNGVRGPFLVLAANQDDPLDETCCVGGNCAAGNVFAKGYARTRGGTTYLLWTVRHTFADANCATGLCLHGYDLFLAKTTDGVTWSNYAGTAAFTPSETFTDALPFVASPRIGWSSAYRIYQGELNQRSVTTFDVDSRGRVAVLLRRLNAGTSACGFVDQSDPAVTIKLSLLEYDGAATVTDIDATENWSSVDGFLAFDNADNLYIGKMKTATFAPNGVTAAGYAVRPAREYGGLSTLGSWQALGPSGTASQTQARPSYTLTADRRALTVAYYGREPSGDLQMFFRRLVSLANGTRCCK